MDSLCEASSRNKEKHMLRFPHSVSLYLFFCLSLSISVCYLYLSLSLSLSLSLCLSLFLSLSPLPPLSACMFLAHVYAGELEEARITVIFYLISLMFGLPLDLDLGQQSTSLVILLSQPPISLR